MKKTLIILIILAFVGLSEASFISLTPGIDNENVVTGNESVLTFTLSNSGDEPAYDVVISLFLPVGMRSEDLFAGRLDDNSSFSGRFRIRLDDTILPGAYSIPLMVDYKDANGHPFSAVYSFSQVVRQAAFSKVTPRFDDLEITDRGGGDLKLSLRNLDEKAHQVKVKFFLPRELRSDEEEKIVSVSGKSDSDTAFSVSSFDALAGSSYAVFAVVSYEEDGIHYSTYSSGIVKVVAEKPLPGWIPSWLPLAALAGLILIVIVYQLKK
jgi:uncharacterized repeat protein (TIGR01451 family)